MPRVQPNFQAAPLSPKQLVLDILATSRDTVGTLGLVLGGELLGMQAGAVRVAINRLATAGAITSPQRGHWQLVRETPWARETERWLHLPALVAPWDGSWWLALTHPVPRMQKAAWRGSERALLHRGFREVQPQVWLRPASLQGGLESLRQALLALDLSERCLMAEARSLSWPVPRAAWACEAQNQALSDVLADMQALLAAEADDGPPLDALCRNFFLIGRRAQGLLNTDPLLPESWAGASPLWAVQALMPDFIETARRLWRRRLGLDDAAA